MNDINVHIRGIAIATEGLTVRSNQDITDDLAANSRVCRDFWFTDKCKAWWQSNRPNAVALREKYEAKFTEEIGRSPRLCCKADWTVLYERFVSQETQTDPQWILGRTGISRRQFAGDGVATSQLAADAARRALYMSGRPIDAVDGLFLATVSPDHHTTPPTYALVCQELGISLYDKLGKIRDLTGCDSQAACCSFEAQYQNAYYAVKSGRCNCAIVVGADKMSTTMSPYSRNIYPILSDGAGALVLIRETRGESIPQAAQFFSCIDPTGSGLIINRRGGSALPVDVETVENPFDQDQLMYMDGPEVFRKVVEFLMPGKDEDEAFIPTAVSRFQRVSLGTGFLQSLLSEALNRYQLILFHQANGRILDIVEKKLQRAGYTGEFHRTIDRYGNSTSAAIPTLLYDAWLTDKLKYGTRTLVVVFGGGFTAFARDFTWNLNLSAQQARDNGWLKQAA